MCVYMNISLSIYLSIYLSLSTYLKGTEKVMKIDQAITAVMGTEHDVNGIE